jgi:hypothetical protein
VPDEAGHFLVGVVTCTTRQLKSDQPTMTEFPILDETRTESYDSPMHGDSTIRVDVIDYLPCLDSWSHTPEHWDYDPIHLEKDRVKRPQTFRGQDLTKTTVTLVDEGGRKHARHASLNRTVRHPYQRSESDVGWKTSCMIRESTGIFIRPGGDNRTDIYRGEHEMLWDYSCPGPITLDDLLDRLIEEAHRLFEPKMQTRI